MSPNAVNLPFAVVDFRGTGGVIRQRLDDFFVQEIPAYEPSGDGEHVLCEVQKAGMTTPDAVKRLARAHGVRPGDIGYAGLKDARAITRQVFSIPRVTEEGVMTTPVDGLDVLWAARHRNKVRRGHLAGNRFAIRIREVEPTDVVRLKPLFERLRQHGVPNYFGPQRFGRDGDNDIVGFAILRGDRDAARGWSPTVRRLCVSAAQSRVFNAVVAARLRERPDDGLTHLYEGDLAYKHEHGACFGVQDAARERPRVEAFEISPTGPMFGRKMTRPTGRAGEIESATFEAFDVPDDGFAASRDGPPGERRPIRVRPDDVALSGGVDDHGPHLTIAFTLPAGAFATTVLREVMRVERVGGDGRED